MNDAQRPDGESGSELIRGILAIVLLGAGLGIGYNVMLQRNEVKPANATAGWKPTRSLPWIREEKQLAKLEDLTGDAPASWIDSSTVAPASMSGGTTSGGATDPAEPRPVTGPGSTPKSTTPESGSHGPAQRNPHADADAPPPAASAPPATATPTTPPAATTTPAATKVVLPHIPDTRDPMEVQIATVKKFYDAGAAVVVDARTREEFAEKHIAGAYNLPYDDTFKDPTLVPAFKPQPKPVIVYCGGGDCELSKNLAYALIESGHKKVLVYMGGFPEWEKAGYPVATGATP
jgi:rhodanese-related sulfurtransferase